MIAVPSPFHSRELLVLGAEAINLSRIWDKAWQADLEDRALLACYVSIRKDTEA